MLIKITRKAIGQLIILADKLTSPSSLDRHPDEQCKIDEITKNLYLYEMKACPYCVKVRREIKRLSLNIKKMNVKTDPDNKQSLIANGGKFQVPCLRIKENNHDRWLYESTDIINYLRKLCD